MLLREHVAVPGVALVAVRDVEALGILHPELVARGFLHRVDGQPIVADAVAEPGRARDDAVDAVGADQDPGAKLSPVDAPHEDIAGRHVNVGDARPLDHVDADRASALQERRVEVDAAQRQVERVLRLGADRGARGRFHDHAADLVERDGLREIRRQVREATEHAPPDPAAARLVARKPVAVQETCPDAAARERDPRHRSRGTATDDQDIGLVRLGLTRQRGHPV